MLTLSHTSQKKEFLSHKAAWQTLFQVLGASALMALCSQIKIVLPFTLVPLTLQTLAVLSIGATLGSRKGAWAILLYFAQILAGLPVLSGGAADPLVFLGPKGGYVLGFCLQAFLMGWMVERMPWSKPVTLLIGGLLACSVQMGLGVCVLAQFVSWSHVWTMGLFPFLPGEILKVLIVSWGFTLRKTLT
jgi:biotin transport system substrate-specific component